MVVRGYQSARQQIFHRHRLPPGCHKVQCSVPLSKGGESLQDPVMVKGSKPGAKRWRPTKPPVSGGLPAVIQEVVLPAPPLLNFGSPEQISALYEYFALIRSYVVWRGFKVVVDLRQCIHVGPVGVLLLAAEVERCNYVRPGSVSGYSPTDERARASLSRFGFHKAIGVRREGANLAKSTIVQLASGVGRTKRLSQNLGKVAGLTFDLWGDQAFTDRVHGALNEAMTNVLMHAYDPELIEGSDACESGKWWVAGFSMPAEDGAWFMALDLGVGIPKSAPAKNKDLQAYLSRPTQRHDAAIIKLLVDDEERSRTGLPQHGKGVPTMVALVRNRAANGTVWIVSGRGCFILDKNMDRPEDRRIHELAIPLMAKAAGTLILWKIGRSKMEAE